MNYADRLRRFFSADPISVRFEDGEKPLARPAAPETLPLHRPWRIPNAAAVAQYVGSLSHEMQEWLIALYVDRGLNLLSVETLGIGSVSEVQVDFGELICRGRRRGAAGFILVHNHPAGKSEPSRVDMRLTARLRHVSHEMNFPLLDHFVVAKSGIQRVGHW